MKALVLVKLKPEVLDPQGKAIARACASLGHGAISGVRQGKLFEIDLDVEEVEAARALTSEIATKLLANPVIEYFEILDLA